MTIASASQKCVTRVLLAAGLTLAAAGLAQAQTKTEIIFSAGPTGGSWTPLAASVSQVVNSRVPDVNVAVEPGAALVNMEKIRMDKADLGWSMTTVVADAREGKGQFAGKPTDKALFIANFYPTSGSSWCRKAATSRASRISRASPWRYLHAATPAWPPAGSTCSRSTA